METKSHKYEVVPLSDSDMEWFVETAAVRMLKEEVNRPEYVDIENLYVLASTGAISGTAFVVKKEGNPVGAIGGILSPHLFNPKMRMLTEVFWYVLPEYRNTRAGLLLLDAYSKKAEEVSDEASFSLLKTSTVKKETLERKGFEFREYAFCKEYWRK